MKNTIKKSVSIFLAMLMMTSCFFAFSSNAFALSIEKTIGANDLYHAFSYSVTKDNEVYKVFKFTPEYSAKYNFETKFIASNTSHTEYSVTREVYDSSALNNMIAANTDTFGLLDPEVYPTVDDGIISFEATKNNDYYIIVKGDSVNQNAVLSIKLTGEKSSEIESLDATTYFGDYFLFNENEKNSDGIYPYLNIPEDSTNSLTITATYTDGTTASWNQEKNGSNKLINGCTISFVDTQNEQKWTDGGNNVLKIYYMGAEYNLRIEVHDYEEINIPSTCNKQGTQTFKCKNDGFNKTIFQPFAPHTYEQNKLFKPATLNEDGIIADVCSVCGTKKDGTEAYIPKINSVNLAGTSFVFAGKGVTPSVTVKDRKGKILELKKDYTVSYSSNTKIGTATATIAFVNNYSGEIKKTFKIVCASPKLNLTTRSTNYAKFTWNKVSGATSYRLIVTKNGKAYKTITLGNVSYYTLNGLTPGEQYGVKLGAYNTSVSKYCLAYSGSISYLTKTPKISLSSLSTNSYHKIIAKWNKTNYCSGYQVQLSTSSKFNSGLKTITASGNKSYSRTFSSLKKGRRYYVRVRCYKTYKSGSTTKYDYGSWSSYKSIICK